MLRCSFVGFLLFLCATSLSPGVARAAPSADVYGNGPDISSPLISPDGKHLAFLAPLGDNGGVKMISLDGASENCGYAPSSVKVRGIFWINSQRLAIQVSFFFRPVGAPSDLRYQSEVYRYVTMNTDCRDSYDVLRDHKDYGRLGGFNFIGRAEGGNKLLFAAYTYNLGNYRYSLDVYKIDAATGKSESFQLGMPDTDDWMSDAAGDLRLRFDGSGRSQRVFARLGASSDWHNVYDSSKAADEAHDLSFVAMAAQPDVAYVVTRNGGDKDAVYEFNLSTKSLGRLIYQNAKVDVDGVRLDTVSGQAVGTMYTEDYQAVEYFDRSYAQMQADVEATFPGERVFIRSAASDRKKYIVFVEGPQHPVGTYYLVDMNVPSIGKLGHRYNAIAAGDVGAVKSFSYPARDGLKVPAYLTLPPGSSGKNLPLVVMPHGGPHARDTASFDVWAQFLASHGYAVLQPQFRGSSGYGAKHLDAGKFKWGLDMQHDVTDGVKHLIASGTADASRVCIYGWSYGGYAAMAGMVFTPELYKCGIAGAGVSDLLLFLGDAGRQSQGRGKFWKDYIGSPINDRDRLIATSPIRHAAKVRAPLLLIHPKEDTVVPIRQSGLMAEALRNAGKHVEYVELDGDDHWLSRASTSKRVLRELEAFLAKHLK